MTRPTLIGRRWDSLTRMERGDLRDGVILDHPDGPALWLTRAGWVDADGNKDRPLPDHVVELVPAIPTHASAEVAEAHPDDRDITIAHLRATLDTRNAEVTALSSERMDLRAEVVKARAAGMEEAAKVADRLANVNDRRAAEARGELEFDQRDHFWHMAEGARDAASAIRLHATNPRASGEPAAFLFAVSTKGRVVQLGCGWDEDTGDTEPAVVIVPTAWWRERGCWCDDSDQLPELPDGFHSILSGAWEYWGTAEDAVRALMALGFEQRPEIIDGAVMISHVTRASGEEKGNG